MQVDKLEAVDYRVTSTAKEILACHEAGVTVTLQKRMRESDDRFGRQDFVYITEEDIHRAPPASG